MEFELNELHLAYLKRIRWIRTRFTLRAYGGLLLLPVLFLLVGLIGGYKPEQFTWSEYWIENSSIFVVALIIVHIGAVPIWINFLIRWRPISKDIKLKTGCKINKQIIRKHHFPISNEYFLFFQEPNIPNIKVDRLTYGHYNVGDYFSILTAKHSQIVFEDYDRFDII